MSQWTTTPALDHFYGVFVAFNDNMGPNSGIRCVAGLATGRSCRKRTVDPVAFLWAPSAQSDCRLRETLRALPSKQRSKSEVEKRFRLGESDLS